MSRPAWPARTNRGVVQRDNANLPEHKDGPRGRRPHSSLSTVDLNAQLRASPSTTRMAERHAPVRATSTRGVRRVGSAKPSGEALNRRPKRSSSRGSSGSEGRNAPARGRSASVTRSRVTHRTHERRASDTGSESKQAPRPRAYSNHSRTGSGSSLQRGRDGRSSRATAQRTWVQKLQKLSQRERLLESELHRLISSGTAHTSRTWQQTWSELQRDGVEVKASQERERSRLRRAVQDIQHMSRRFTITVSAAKEAKQAQSHSGTTPPPELFERVRTALDELEARLHNFKTVQAKTLSELSDADVALTDELAAFNARLIRWEEDPSSFIVDEQDESDNTSNTRVQAIKATLAAELAQTSLQDVSRPVTADVSAHEDPVRREIEFIRAWMDEHGGTTGGWDDRDHQMYLKLKARISNRVDMLSRAAKEIPEQTLKSVSEHDVWYDRWKLYHERRKLLVAEWRDAKERKRKEEVKARSEEAERARQAEAAERRAARERDQKRKQAEVRTWREEQRRRREAEEAEARARQEAERRAAEERRRTMQEERRRMIEAHRLAAQVEEKKQQQAQSTQETLSMEDRVRQRETRRRLQQRNEALIQQAAQRYRANQQQEAARRERAQLLAERLAPARAVERDPDRLTRETAAQRRRRLEREQEREVHELARARGARSQPLMSQPISRGVPGWRKGL